MSDSCSLRQFPKAEGEKVERAAYGSAYPLLPVGPEPARMTVWVSLHPTLPLAQHAVGYSPWSPIPSTQRIVASLASGLVRMSARF